mgnify:CR=1 FL=1
MDCYELLGVRTSSMLSMKLQFEKDQCYEQSTEYSLVVVSLY